MIFIIKGFRTIVFVIIVISTTFRLICPPAFFRWLSKVPEFDYTWRRLGGHIGRNVVEITIKMKTLVRKPLMIIINYIYIYIYIYIGKLFLNLTIEKCTNMEKRRYLDDFLIHSLYYKSNIQRFVFKRLSCRINFLMECGPISASRAASHL